MANILTFPETGPRTGGDVKRQAFLQDGDDTLHFDAQNLANDHPFALPTEQRRREMGMIRTRDWSNQELANLFRVKRLLDAAGVPNEIDRGLTDEGDPWFVFCDTHGDVFIHLCRLDGVYVLDSPNISHPLRGRDFNALIEDFTGRKAPGESEMPETRRVVRLERNGKVFLHPSTMLAALVWTLFLASEDLVMILPEKAAGTDDLSDDLVSGFGAADHDTGHDAGLDPLHLALQEHATQDAAAGADGFVPLDATGMDAFTEEKLGQNTYAIGLSAVAISLGFMSEAHLPEVDTLTLESLLAMITGQDAAQGAAMDAAADEAALAQTGAQDLIAALAQFFDDATLAAGDDKALAVADADAVADVGAAQNADHGGHGETPVQNVQSQLGADLEDQPPLRDAHAPVELSESDLVSPADAAPQPASEQTVAYSPETEQMAEMFSRLGLMAMSENIETNAREYTFDDTVVLATFDVNTVDLQKTTGLITGALDVGRPEDAIIDIEASSGSRGQLPAYDASAFEFLSFLTSKDGDLEMIATGNELILLDPEVFNVDVGDTFAASWVLDNGEVISAVGLRSDYEAYDLIG